MRAWEITDHIKVVQPEPYGGYQWECICGSTSNGRFHSYKRAVSFGKYHEHLQHGKVYTGTHQGPQGGRHGTQR